MMRTGAARRAGKRHAAVFQFVAAAGLRRRVAVRISLRLDPVRIDHHAACRHARHPLHRLRQYRRDQRAAHRAQGSRRRDAAGRYAQGHLRRPRHLLFLWPGYRYFAHELAIPAAFGAFLGHLFPVWLRFKGGKGVATYIGLLLGLAWPVALAFCLIWLAVAAITRYSSLAALVASAATPFALWMLGTWPEPALFALLTVLLWIMHRANIARLMNGTEGKIGKTSEA